MRVGDPDYKPDIQRPAATCPWSSAHVESLVPLAKFPAVHSFPRAIDSGFLKKSASETSTVEPTSARSRDATGCPRPTQSKQHRRPPAPQTPSQTPYRSLSTRPVHPLPAERFARIRQAAPAFVPATKPPSHATPAEPNASELAAKTTKTASDPQRHSSEIQAWREP